MACHDVELQQVNTEHTTVNSTQADLEYDFIGEDISKDFFCPVSLELLLHLPQLTECCGHHLSHPVVERLKRDHKPCPLCKEPNLVTHNDKYFERKVRELRVRCPYKDKGCVWEGCVASHVTHASSCPKQPWICQHCKFTSTLEVGASEHAPTCLKRSEPCPNQCEVTFVPHCDMEMHLSQCPLQPVVCTFEEAGCKEEVLRKDLPRHLKEGAQEHMLSAALLNLRLTREFQQQLKEKEKEILEKDHQLKEKDKQLEKEVLEKDHQLKEKDQQLKEKDHQLKEKDQQLKEKDHQLKEKDQQLKEKDQQLKEKDKQLKMKDQQLKEKGKQSDKQFQEMYEQLKEKDQQLKKKDKQLDNQVKEEYPQLKEKDGQLKKKDVQTLNKQSITGFSNLFADLRNLHQLLVKKYEKYDIVLRRFSEYSKGKSWYSGTFLVHDFPIKLNIDVSTEEINDYDEDIYSDDDDDVESGDAESSDAGESDAESSDADDAELDEEETHLLAYVQAEDCDDWPINLSCYLQLLNQLGDYGHLVMSRKDTRLEYVGDLSLISTRTILLKDLFHNSELKTVYLKEDCLHFRLYIKTTD